VNQKSLGWGRGESPVCELDNEVDVDSRDSKTDSAAEAGESEIKVDWGRVLLTGTVKKESDVALILVGRWSWAWSLAGNECS
jgi:hypothetical protein